MQIIEIPARSLLNPTGGFLGDGFTHTINLYRGCALGNSLCGLYCYAQWNGHHTRGRPWGSFLDVKTGVVDAYRSQYETLKHPARGEPKPLRIFMSSVTEPYPPQERTARRTRSVLEEMLSRPPDQLVVQTHTPLVLDDLPLLQELARRCRLTINITVETDMAELPPEFPRHAYTPSARIQALRTLRAAGLTTVAAVSPLLPLRHPHGFAEELERACHHVILDHYLLGDGSPQGLRTKRTPLPMVLDQCRFGEWKSLAMFEQIVAIFRAVLGSDRVGISRSGFNATQYAPQSSQLINKIVG